MSWVAAAVGGVSLLTGGIQALGGHKKAKNAEREIENLKSPTYTPNSSILDYYNKALQRYNTNPYQSQQYQYGIQQGNRNTAAGVNALQDRGSAVGGISRLIALQNENALRQGMSAEQEQNQRFGQLGGATQMKASDDQYGFNINQLMPYQQKLQLLGMKAGAGANQENQGLTNIFNGLGNAASIGADYFMNRPPTQKKPAQLKQVDVKSGSPSWVGSYQDPGLNAPSSSIFDYQNPYGE